MRQPPPRSTRAARWLWLGLILPGLGLVGCDGDNAVTPGVDMMPDAEVITGRPDLGGAATPEPSAELIAHIDAFGGDVGLYAVDLETAAALGHEAETRFPAAGLSALLATVAYATRVEAGDVLAERSVQLRPSDVRGAGLSQADAGKVFTLSDLTKRALDGDRTAEHLLVHTLGGAEAVDAALVDLGLTGVGDYLDPCARDRVYAEALDPRFADVECDDLGRWLHGDNAGGIVPAPFASPPSFDDAQRAAAASARVRSAAGTVTARGFAGLLARLDAGALASPAVDARVRGFLDGGRAAGGGDDGLPASVWSGSMEGPSEDGRHWAGRIRSPGGEAFVLVVLNAGGDDVDALTRALGAGTWTELIGGIAWPPNAPADTGEATAQLMDAAASDACDQAPNGFDGQVVCRTGAAAEVFSPGDAVTASLIAPGPGPLEASWIWDPPGGRRVRTQQRLAPSAWWVWSETRRVFAEGEWSVTVSVDGAVIRTIPFTVSAE